MQGHLAVGEDDEPPAAAAVREHGVGELQKRHMLAAPPQRV